MQSYQFNYSLYNKRVKTTKKEGFTVIVIAIIILMGLAFFISTNISRNDNYFFVEVGNFFKYTDATSLAGEIQSKGGAGYVYYDGSYHVLTSFYLSKEDAESVCSNLIETYPSTKIFTIEQDKLKTNKNLSKQEQQFITKINKANKTLYEGLYTAITRYDTSADNINQLSLNLTSLYDNYLKETDDIKNFFNNPTQFASKNYILDITECTKGLKDNINEANHSSVLKYDLIKIVMLHCSFINSL